MARRDNDKPRVNNVLFVYGLGAYNFILLFLLFPAKKMATLLFGPFKMWQKNLVLAVFVL